MSARGRARTRAVEVLFEAEQRDEPALEVMTRRRAHEVAADMDRAGGAPRAAALVAALA